MMKKIILLIAIIGLLSSCSNDDDSSDIKVIEKNITLQNSENHEFSLGFFGDEQGARIVTQARHFEISDLNREVDEIIYTYKSESDFIGSDLVEIDFVNFEVATGTEKVLRRMSITFNVTE